MAGCKAASGVSGLMPPFADYQLTVSARRQECVEATCPNFASSVVPESFLASPEYLRMTEGVLDGGSVISISMVRVRAMHKLFSGQHKPESAYGVQQEWFAGSPGN